MSGKRLHLDVKARFGAFELAVETALPVEGVSAIFGASGSGKSSLLRLIAGFERPTSGHIRLGSQVWVNAKPAIFVPAHKRGVAYVFQDGRLLGHLTVQGNLRYGEKRFDRAHYTYTYDDVVEAFDLGDLMARRPDTLSGGERQRVALAQALLTRPRLLLLDEPLSALDQGRKQEILPYLDSLQSQFAVPMLYVSHDLREVLGIADRVLMLDAGKKLALGGTVETLNMHGFATDGPGKSGIILSGHVAHVDTAFHLMRLQIGENILSIPCQSSQSVGALVRVVLRASDMALSLKPPQGLSIQNSLKGHVKTIRSAPERTMASVTVCLGADMDIPVQVTRAAIADLGLEVGSLVYALVKTASLIR